MLFILGRSSKSNSECADTDSSIEVNVQATKRTTKVSSICLNIPAVGLGARPPSITSTDEGGFNEPSPEIKAKLKPAYTFDPSEIERIECQIDTLDNGNELPLSSSEIVAEHSTDYNNAHHTLHYVDFGYRLNPDGSESRNIFGETELYDRTTDTNEQQMIKLENNKNEVIQKDEVFRSLITTNNTANNFGVSIEDTVVYATIKPEVPPPSELFLKSDYNNSSDLLDTEIEKNYHSPQTILDPTRPSLANKDDIRLGNHAPEPPPRPPLPEGPPLDMQDVEFADASDKEEYLAEDMTADEAERLLSSR